MTIVGFNFMKINAERKHAPGGKIGIQPNISINDVAPTDMALGKNKENGLVFSFEYRFKYEPGVGEILMAGEVFYMDEAKKTKDILDKWKKDKKLEPELLGEVLGAATQRCNVEAILLSREVNLPSPIRLPNLVVKKQ
jgi:hypothetical protein